jgi:hypothetical protein
LHRTILFTVNARGSLACSKFVKQAGTDCARWCACTCAHSRFAHTTNQCLLRRWHEHNWRVEHVMSGYRGVDNRMCAIEQPSCIEQSVDNNADLITMRMDFEIKHTQIKHRIPKPADN